MPPLAKTPKKGGKVKPHAQISFEEFNREMQSKINERTKSVPKTLSVTQQVMPTQSASAIEQVQKDAGLIQTLQRKVSAGSSEKDLKRVES